MLGTVKQPKLSKYNELMAKFTIKIMGKQQGERIMASILQSVSRYGKYHRDIIDNVEPHDLMANQLVQYGILSRRVLADSKRFEYSEGNNFVAAKLKGAHIFIEEENKRLNPSTIRGILVKLDKSNIFIAIFSAILGALLAILTMLFLKNA